MRRSIVISVVMVLCVLGLLLFGFGTQTEVPAAPPVPLFCWWKMTREPFCCK